jgi:CheY-like chemotaxis protein
MEQSMLDQINPNQSSDSGQYPFCEGVLIIDDEKDIRESLQQFLEFDDYPVKIASNGSEGLSTLSQLPLPQLILLDLMMPVMDGWAFAEALRAQPILSGCPVVVMSAFSERADSILSQGVLQKPIHLDKMTALIQKFVKRRSSLDVE